jgi:hypothetical protein
MTRCFCSHVQLADRLLSSGKRGTSKECIPEQELNLFRGFGTLAALLLFSVAAPAQAVPGATSAFTLNVFLGGTGTSTGLGSSRNAGLTAGATLGFHPFLHVTPALEIRGTLPTDQGSVDGQKNVVGGLQVATQFRRFHPYANILFGRGEITYLNGGYQVPGKFVFYTASHDNVLSPGGGIDFSVSSAWSMKLDYQHQRYATPVVPSGYLSASTFMVGLEYRFVFARIERRKF